jgi:hypothetical protein
MGNWNPGGPLANKTPQQINDALTETQKNSLNGIYPQKTGQTTSYANGDDGFFQYGRPTPGFLTLAVNNPFGNTNRFTNDLGGSATNGSDGSTANYIIDWVTGYGWCITEQASATWATAIGQYLTFTLGTYANFFVPDVNELCSIMNHGVASGSYLNYAPFNNTNISHVWWSSTTYWATTTTALAIRGGSATSFILPNAKTGTNFYYLCRKHLT